MFLSVAALIPNIQLGQDSRRLVRTCWGTFSTLRAKSTAVNQSARQGSASRSRGTASFGSLLTNNRAKVVRSTRSQERVLVFVAMKQLGCFQKTVGVAQSVQTEGASCKQLWNAFACNLCDAASALMGRTIQIPGFCTSRVGHGCFVA